MTPDKLLQAISDEIQNRGAGDIDSRRLSFLSLGELLPFLAQYGIELCLGNAELSDEELTRQFATRIAKIRGNAAMIVDVVPLDQDDPTQLADAKAEEFVNSIPEENLKHPLVQAIFSTLKSKYEKARQRNPSLPPIPVMELLKRRMGQ